MATKLLPTVYHCLTYSQTYCFIFLAGTKIIKSSTALKKKIVRGREGGKIRTDLNKAGLSTNFQHSLVNSKTNFCLKSED